ncbi:MAG: hypothetical protein LBK95_11605, partial [Bifidobacteriaceae bacterium]|nr:hypothetical protein [Bifidobacteriaceae bacterium]
PWDGSDEYETIAGDRFTHDAVAVPGDWIQRTLVVRNNGPCPGWLTVEILNPNASSAADTVNDDDLSVTAPRVGFAGMSELHWDVDGTVGSSPFSSLVDRQPLARVLVGKDASVPVQMAYKFPYEETEGKHLGFPSQALTWGVGLKLQGDYCESPLDPEEGDETPLPTPSASGTISTTPAPSDAAGPPGDDHKSSGGGSNLEYTGTNAMFAIISAVFLVTAGATLVMGRRRDRDRGVRA